MSGKAAAPTQTYPQLPCIIHPFESHTRTYDRTTFHIHAHVGDVSRDLISMDDERLYKATLDISAFINCRLQNFIGQKQKVTGKCMWCHFRGQSEV